jgi:DNA polymerase III delta prime subunit
MIYYFRVLKVFMKNDILFQGIKGLMYTSEGDLRKAITFLQSAARLKGDSEITKQDIYEIAGVSEQFIGD